MSASCHVCLGRERALPGPSQCQEQGVLGCRAHSPPQCHTAHGAARNTAGSWQPWSWIWPLAAGRRLTWRVQGCPWSCAPFWVFTHGHHQQGEGRFAKGSLQICCPLAHSTQLPQAALGEAAPPDLRPHPWIKDRLQSSIVPASCQASGEGGEWTSLVQSNNFANQDKLIKEGSTERAVPVRLGGSDASPASGPIFSKNLNQILIILLKTGRSKRRRSLAGMTDLFMRDGGRNAVRKVSRVRRASAGPSPRPAEEDA